MQNNAPIVNTCQTAWPWSQYNAEPLRKHQAPFRSFFQASQPPKNKTKARA